MQQGLKLGILTYVHFCVDFVCSFWLNYSILFDGTWVGVISCYVPANGNKLFWVMLYNFCAFALQLPLGILFDRLRQKEPWRVAAFGCVLIGIAGMMGFYFNYTYYTLSRIFSIFILLGLGNALFHIGAGVRVLQMGEKMAHLGIFISTGAIGACLGSVFCSTVQRERMYGGRENLALFILILLLSFASVAVLLLGSKMDALKMFVYKNGWKGSADISVHKDGQKGFVNAVLIFLLFFVVALHSFQGSFVWFPWKKGIPLIVIFALRIAAGRALGGILADQFGVPLALLPLLLSAFLFLQPENLLFGLAAVLFFQTAMPIILSLLREQLPALPGTAFGLLSFALFVGYLPKYFSIYSGINLYGHRVVIGGWSLYRVCCHIHKWWVKYQETYAYSILAGISFLLLVFLLCLRYRYRKER